MLEDVGAEDPMGPFSMGERVELAITMENKAKVSRVGAPKPQVGPPSPLALPHCPSQPFPGQTDRK